MAFGNRIFARAGDVAGVQVGETVQVVADYCMITDGASHRSIACLKPKETVFDPEKVAVFIDHDTPSGSEAASVIQRNLINFARKHSTLYHQGEGVGYQLMLDHYIQKGQIIVGCGDHMSVFGAAGALGLSVNPEQLAEVLRSGKFRVTVPECVKIELKGNLAVGISAKDIILTIIRDLAHGELTGKLIEFSGSAFRSLTLNDRITLCNLAGRTKAVSALVNTGECPDDSYAAVSSYDLGTIEPMIAGDDFGEIVEASLLSGVKVNEVFIGGCASGRIEDLRIVADIIRGKRVAKGVRLMIAPVTADVYIQALQEGLITAFIDAGAVIMNQGCSVCWGKSQGIIDSDEVLISGGSYNAKGWAGADTATIYIASATTAAKSAISGVILS